MVKSTYIPDRGDIVWLDFSPQTGHEQKGKRPALVISPFIYNEKSGLAIFCPITTVKKGYPFEVDLPKDITVNGVILADQLKSLDWRARNAEIIEKLTDNVYNEVEERIKLLVL